MDFINTNLPYLLAGISVGGQYALIAIGYTMVYGILRLINFAHGDVFMCAGLIMIYAVTWMPLYIAIPFTLLVTVLIGFLIERVAYKPLRTAPRMSVMISAIGVSYLLQNVALYVTGGLAKMYPTIPWISNTVTIGTATTKVVTIITPILTLVLVIALVTFIQKTKIGMAMRAVSKDFETSQLMGIKINNVISATFIIGSFLAAVGSLLYFTNRFTVLSTSSSTSASRLDVTRFMFPFLLHWVNLIEYVPLQAFQLPSGSYRTLPLRRLRFVAYPYKRLIAIKAIPPIV